MLIKEIKLRRCDVFSEELPKASELLADGRLLARDWQVGDSAFLSHYDVSSEYEYKRRCMKEGRVMQHAQVGFRDVGRSCEAYHRVWAECDDLDVRVDRVGLCLDWSMAVPRDQRSKATRFE